MDAEALRPPRSLLFVPGDRPDLLAKVGRWNPDIAVLDLEDAIPASAKDRARALVAEAAGAPGPGGVAVAVRVNGPATPWFDADVAALARTAVPIVVLPKLEDPAEVARLRDAFAARPDAPGVAVIGGIETARGVADARVLAAAGLAAVYFGAEDFIADLGGRRTAHDREVLYARSQVVLAARLAGIPAIDQAVVAVRDTGRFRADAAEGAAMGYQGKICVHPDQVAIAHEEFTPSPAQVEHARAVLDAAKDGITVVDGQMVDAVHLRMAENILRRATGRPSDALPKDHR